MKPEDHGRWKGGTYYKNGYVYERIAEDSPYRAMGMTRPYVLQHRLRMAEKLGRPLHKDEHVHHINGVRDDNRHANLELWSTFRQPKGSRVVDLLAYAHEIVARYGSLED